MTVFMNCVQKGRDHFKLCSVKRGRYPLCFPGPLLCVFSLLSNCKFLNSRDLSQILSFLSGFYQCVVLEKTLESPLDCKEIQPVHSEGGQPWDIFGRNEAKAETPVLWPPHAKS